MPIDVGNVIKPLLEAIDVLRKGGVTEERLALYAERVQFLKDQLEMVSKRVVILEKENAELIAENAKLNEQLAYQHVSEEFIEHRGALFRREASGLYGGDPICPTCGSTMAAVGSSRIPVRCGNQTCRRTAAFKMSELSGIIRELNSRR